MRNVLKYFITFNKSEANFSVWKLSACFIYLGLMAVSAIADDCGCNSHSDPAPQVVDWKPHTPEVVVTIKPIHSLVAGVMEGIAAPKLLIEDNSSPHFHALKPSEFEIIKKAELLVFVGDIYETGLNLSNMSDNKQIIDLSKIKQLKLYPVRQGGFWDNNPCCQSNKKECGKNAKGKEEICHHPAVHVEGQSTVH